MVLRTHFFPGFWRLSPKIVLIVGFLSHGVIAVSGQEAVEQKPAQEIIVQQQPPKVMQRVLQRATQDNTHLYVSLGKQMAWVFVENEVAIETPISSGKKAAMTPTGSFSIQEKLSEQRSMRHGDFVDASGRVIRSGVSAKLDSAPGGTTFQQVPKKFFLRLNAEELGIHAGNLPGYPASHRSIRLPEAIARLVFENTKVGTLVEIGE